MDRLDKQDQKLIDSLNKLRDSIVPNRSSYQKMLANLSEKSAVTKYYSDRYSFSMWKYLTSAALVLIVVVAVVYFYKNQSMTNLPYRPQNQTQTTTQPQNSASVPNQPVTQANADATFQQTDQAIQQSMDQMDQDFKSLDQSNSSENDLDNI